ncbi:phospholipase A2-like [Anopheles ziemanni]|uniref:phospholipase A2-like n=1 Tax=Anopheles coustani TaxID=139045 RepID=UPI002658EE0A|nr:phospholipase A2-like [Anopheles coustani]XP_058170034.1 phospholipase A2-like [Anopheles ziemanni]
MKLAIFLVVCFTARIARVDCTRLLYKNVETFDFENEIDSGEQGKSRSNRTVERINLTVPGTKWCGPGNTASDYEDLGSNSEVDACCRDHDHCDNIPAGETKYGLKNNDYFTRLHCKCDRDFQNCLRRVNTTFSNKLGNFYFTVRDQCYKKQHPIVDCAEHTNKVFLRRCVRYTLDTSRSDMWQWFDLPFYDGNVLDGF